MLKMHTNHHRALSLACLLLAMLSITTARPALAQGTDQVFPDPMGFEQMSELLAPLELSEQQRQFIRSQHRAYLESFRQLRENEINSYLTNVGTGSLEHSDDRSKIVDGTKRIRTILERISQIDVTFFESIRPTLSDAQASQLQRLADRRTRQRLSSRHGSWDWSMPSLLNMDMARAVQRSSLEPEQIDAIDDALAAYEQLLTPIFAHVHGKRLDLPLAHHDKTADARRVFQQRMSDIESRLADPESNQERARRELERLVSQGDYWQPATSSKDLDEAQAIRSDIARISKMNRQLLAEFAATLDPSAMRLLERSYQRRAFGMLRIPSDPLRRRVAKKLADDALDVEMRTAIESLYDGYTIDRRPLVNQLVSHAEDQEFLGTSQMIRFSPNSNTSEKPKNPIEDDRQQIRDLNERTLQAYAAITGEEIASGSGRQIDFGNGPIIIDNVDGSGAMELEFDASAMAADLDLGDGIATGAFIAVTGDGDATLPVATNVMVFTGDTLEWDAAGGDFEVLEGGGGGSLTLHTSGVQVPRGWLPGAMTRQDVRIAALGAGIPEEQLPIVDAMHDEYKAAFDDMDSNMLTPIKERLRDLSRPRGDDEISASDIDGAFSGVRSGMDSIAMVDRDLMANLSIIAGVDETDTNIQRATRNRQRNGYRHLGRGSGAMHFMGGGVESKEHEVDIEQIISLVVKPSDQSDELRRILDDYAVSSVAHMQGRWIEELHKAAEQAKRMRTMMRRSADGSATYELNIVQPMTRDAEGADSGPDYQNLLRQLNRDTLESALTRLDADRAYDARSLYKRQSFPAAYRDRAALHQLFDRIEQQQLQPAQLNQVREMKLQYLGEYDAISERLIEIIRTFVDNGGGGSMSPMGPMDPEYFERMQQSQQAMEVERFARRSLNESTRQALHDMLDQTTRDAVGLKSDD